MFDEFQQAARTIFETAQQRGLLIRNPESDGLGPGPGGARGRQTKYGSI